MPTDKFDVKKFLEENSEMFDNLSQALVCPSCHKVVKPPFYNLGETYHWAEGCKKCYDKL